MAAGLPGRLRRGAGARTAASPAWGPAGAGVPARGRPAAVAGAAAARPEGGLAPGAGTSGENLAAC